MRYRTRAFLVCFVPLAILLAVGFSALQVLVRSMVLNGVRQSVRQNQVSIAGLRSRSALQKSRFLRVAGESPALKAGLQLLLSYPEDPSARQTVQDQLAELCGQMGFDLLVVSSPAGKPLAGVVREKGDVVPIDPALVGSSSSHGLIALANELYEAASVPIDHAAENMGSLLVGERFDIGEFHTPAVLSREGRVLASNVSGIPPRDLEAALRACRAQAECSFRFGGRNYLSIHAAGISFGGGYTLRTLEDIDSASAPINAVIRQVFIGASVAAIVAALLFSLLSAGSIVKPIAAMVARLRESERTGMLAEFEGELSSIREIRELTSGFNNAAAAIREGRDNLQSAYVEFVASLAHALDARDRYTAGHSRRVSDLACAISMELCVSSSDLDQIRIGALLHDIGKIGIADRVLQKPGRLTDEEFAVVKEHPEIGKRILERVHGLAPYLGAVEFHHENWDGTGYPSGRQGTDTPLAARIIHVADAYDAMTTDRPYRRGMSHETAVTKVVENAGAQFDPQIVEAFLKVIRNFHTEPEPEYAGAA